MEPTTSSTPDERTTAKHWAIALAFLLLVAIGIPAIAALPLGIAYAITLPLAAIITLATLFLGRARR